MANTLRIKRRAAGGAAGAPASLATAEIAFNEVDRVLYIGFGDSGGGVATSIIAIAGEGAFMSLSGDQTVAGIKTFSSSPLLPTPANGDNSTKAATTAFVQAAVGAAGGGDMLKATYDTNNNGVVDDSERLGGTLANLYALKTYVDGAISNLVNGAGAALDTLNELAVALGNDPNFATTITAGLAAKLAKASNLSDLPDAAAARGNLGLGSMAIQNANAVAITGGSIDGITLNGGTF